MMYILLQHAPKLIVQTYNLVLQYKSKLGKNIMILKKPTHFILYLLEGFPDFHHCLFCEFEYVVYIVITTTQKPLEINLDCSHYCGFMVNNWTRDRFIQSFCTFKFYHWLVFDNQNENMPFQIRCFLSNCRWVMSYMPWFCKYFYIDFEGIPNVST